MTFEVDFKGHSRSVSVSRGEGPDRYVVAIDGRSCEVHATRIGEVGLVLHRLPAEQSTEDLSRQLFVVAAASGEVVVTFEGRTAVMTLNGTRRARAADTTLQTDDAHSITAPMPGRVVRVLVAAGDEVAAGQGIIVVEAMKMENELRSPKAGTVKNVSVAPGASVDAGKVLVVIE
jgi:biotin carboxyl carrier protein